MDHKECGGGSRYESRERRTLIDAANAFADDLELIQTSTRDHFLETVDAHGDSKKFTDFLQTLADQGIIRFVNAPTFPYFM